jgi:cytoskeletal protein CcmA (bactofilin family)
VESQSPDDDSNSLENPETPVTSTGSTAASSETKTNAPEKKKKSGGGIQGIIGKLNIYLLMFILIVVLSAGLVFVGMQRAKKEAEVPTLGTTPLTKEALEKLKDSEAKVGDPKQTLSIESNTIFSGKVLVKDSLDIAGSLKIGGTVNINGLTVSGTSLFDQIQANTLSIAKETTLQGNVKIQKDLTVSGGANFGGTVSVPTLSAQTLNLINDLTFNKHIDAGGSTPTFSSGNALGGGGTTSVSGTDTAGTVTVNIGGSPPTAGCFITVTFAKAFVATPHVVITPVGASAAGLNYYITRSSTNFSICYLSSTPSGSFSFDYIVID